MIADEAFDFVNKKAFDLSLSGRRIKDLKVVSFTLSGASYKGDSKNSDDHETEYFCSSIMSK